MIRLTLIVLFTAVCCTCFSKGGSGEYLITGQALNADNELLCNVTIVIRFNRETSRVTTDSNGNYKLTIGWIIPCRSGFKSRRKYKQRVKKLNPKWIYLTYQGKEVRIKNKYKKYRNLYPENEDQITRNMDIKFV